MKTYSTRTECITEEIVRVIEAGGAAKADEYDIDAIADRVVETDTTGINPKYFVDSDEDRFWSIVAEEEK